MGRRERSGGRLLCRLSAMVVLAALVAAACGRNDSGGGGGREGSSQASSEVGVTRPSASQPKDGGKLTYGLEAETDGFNPTRNRFAVSGLIIGNAVFDPLVAYDADGNTQPYLAQSVEPSDDYRTWTIKLRPGIVFHNGQKADASALKKFIDALKASALTGAAARPIQEARIVDELTVDVVMNQPWVAFPATIVGQAGFLPAPEMLDDPDGMSGHPIGTGPFVFKEWVPGNRFVATKNTSYWRAGMPHLDEVEFRPLPDVQARIQSLQSGTVNMIHF
ncbi:MAG: ABC transporter substrate-binding protein, partial [Acidimicrobiales bacterium]|nr:ABC transporter substrate-binding protein [Acidimicrobiales bacterium]